MKKRKGDNKMLVQESGQNKRVQDERRTGLRQKSDKRCKIVWTMMCMKERIIQVKFNQYYLINQIKLFLPFPHTTLQLPQSASSVNLKIFAKSRFQVHNKINNQLMSTRYSSYDSMSIQKSCIQTTLSASILPKPLKQCRICLQNQEQSNKIDYINPCKCIGTLQFVHESCLQTWIFQSLKSKDQKEIQKILSNGIQCELCKEGIQFQSNLEMECPSKSSTHALIKSKIYFFLIGLLLVVVSAGGLIFSIYNIALYSHQFNTNSGLKFELILSICGAVVLSPFFIAGLLIFIKEFVCIGKYKIKGISKIGKKKRKVKRNQIVPIGQQPNMDISISNLQ